ncbi:MAG: hypothetical protein JXQ75_15580 [Phycisphaerae bacterium]|nr:hypothetical protein [Phycisphaerae bacterium]
MDEQSTHTLTELLSGVSAGRNGVCDGQASTVRAVLRAMAQRRVVLQSTIPEVCVASRVGRAAVKRNWKVAKAGLTEELAEEQS